MRRDVRYFGSAVAAWVAVLTFGLGIAAAGEDISGGPSNAVGTASPSLTPGITEGSVPTAGSASSSTGPAGSAAGIDVPAIPGSVTTGGTTIGGSPSGISVGGNLGSAPGNVTLGGQGLGGSLTTGQTTIGGSSSGGVTVGGIPLDASQISGNLAASMAATNAQLTSQIDAAIAKLAAEQAANAADKFAGTATGAAVTDQIENAQKIQSAIEELTKLRNNLSQLNGNLSAILSSEKAAAMSAAEGKAAGALMDATGNLLGNMLNGSDLDLSKLGPLISDAGKVNAGIAALGGLSNPAQLLQSGALTAQINKLAGQWGGAVMGGLSSVAVAAIGCPTPSCSGADLAAQREDNRYRDMRISGPMMPIDNSKGFDPNSVFNLATGNYVPSTLVTQGTVPLDPGLRGAMPYGAMPGKATSQWSLVKRFPAMYREISDPAARSVLYRGMGSEHYLTIQSPLPNDAATSAQSSAKTNASSVDTALLNATKCRPITDRCGGGPDFNAYERWTRLQYDSCSNQYLLPLGLRPEMVFSPEYKSANFAQNESMCQPLQLAHVDCVHGIDGKCKHDSGSSDGILYDYRAWGYLEKAWLTVLSGNYQPNPADPNHLITGANAKIGGPGVAGAANFGQPFNPASPGIGDPAAAYTGKRTTIKDLSQQPYERIFDPTHPYSPRNDFSRTDRDFSQMTWLNAPFHGYETTGKGLASAPLISSCNVRCAAVPVDILSFRAPEFTACMGCRIAVNTACFWSEVTNLQIGQPWIHVPPDPNAYLDTLHDTPLPGYIVTPQSACKTFYARHNAWPVCSTKFDKPGDAPAISFGGAVIPSPCNSCMEASGDALTQNSVGGLRLPNPSNGVKKCCDDLAQPLVPINTLKIRNTQLDHTGAMPEGYTFKEYFGNHMPYMRWWDTGMAAGGSADSTRNYNPHCDVGQYDTVVGVGRETKSCRYGGGAGLGYKCIALPVTDALTSWEELKQYQANTWRNFGLNCLAQYEKAYKPEAAEDGALTATGGYFYPLVKGQEGKIKAWPLRWRGYVSDPDTAAQFPNLGASPLGRGNVAGGLDKAQSGDIIYLTPQDVEQGNLSVPPTVGVVTRARHTGPANASCTDYLEIVDMNNGKYPDVCGNTNYLGMGPTRTVYKEFLPTAIYDALYPTGTRRSDSCGDVYTVAQGRSQPLLPASAGNCSDARLSQCTYGPALWKKFHIYRPTLDVRPPPCLALTSAGSAADPAKIECPSGNCAENYVGPLTKCINAGIDPPIHMRPGSGREVYMGFSGATEGGTCPPGVDASGKPLPCPTTNGAAAAITVPAINPALNLPSLCAGKTGQIPPLPCGGALSLANQALQIGSVTIGQNSKAAGAVSMAQNVLAGGSCRGSSIAVPENVVSVMLGASQLPQSLGGSTFTPPTGSFLNVPAGTPVNFTINNPGSVSLPAGGSIPNPLGGEPIALPQNSILTSLGGGQVKLPDGRVLNYVVNGSTTTIGIATTALGLPGGSAGLPGIPSVQMPSLPVDAKSILSLPQIVGSPNSPLPQCN